MNTRTICNSLALTGLALCLVSGCSKQSTTEQPDHSPHVNPAATTNAVTQIRPPMPPLPPHHPPVGGNTTAPGKKIKASLTEVEETYLKSTTIPEKIKAMNMLMFTDDPEAVATLGQLFHQEKDAELREEFLETLLDMPGKEEDKLSVLSTAVAPSQPVTVRATAIDILIDLGTPNAIPLLEPLVKDPNPLISDAAKDAIREIQNPTPSTTSATMDDDDDPDSENDVDEK